MIFCPQQTNVAVIARETWDIFNDVGRQVLLSLNFHPVNFQSSSVILKEKLF